MKQLENNDDVTAVLIVLNNVGGIETCLESLSIQGLHSINVIDGGSTDGTIDVIGRYPCNLFKLGKTGLSHARQFGVDKVLTKYVLLVDSDNILESGCVSSLKKSLDESSFIGVSAKKLSFIDDNIYCAFQEWMNSRKINVEGEKLVIGTPSLYLANILQNVRYDSEVKKGDDTDLCFRLRNAGFIVGTGAGVAFEKMQDSFRPFWDKAYLYGEADAEFFLKHKSRRLSMGTHVLRNYFFAMLIRAIYQQRIAYIPLVIIYSAARISGLYMTLIKSAAGLRKNS